jgi:hypothetical protein
LYLANDPGHFGPQSASFAVEAVTFPGNADVLAGESSGNDIDVSAPRLSVEGSHVVPHREWRQHPVSLPGKQHAPWIGSKLNSPDGAPSKDVSAQDASTGPGEEGEFSEL